MTCDGGPKSAIELALATPIGPQMSRLSAWPRQASLSTRALYFHIESKLALGARDIGLG